MITVNIASHKARESYLKLCLMSIIRQNTMPDFINVYLNDYKVQGWMKAMAKKNPIHFVSAPSGDLGASAKFYFVDEQETGVYITIDDDLIAQKGYVGYMADSAYTYPESIVGLHGTRYGQWPVKSYYSDPKRDITYCYGGNELDKTVDMLGTGCMAFRVNMTNAPKLDSFPEKNMTDPYVYHWSAKNNISLVCLHRSAGFVKEIDGSQSTAIWHKVANDDSKQTEVVNKLKNGRALALRIDKEGLGGSSMEWGHVKEILSIVKSDSKVVELGSGKSTRVLNDVCRFVTSFEHDPKWVTEETLHRPIDPKTGWYKLTKTDKKIIADCDIFIVDAPLGSTGERYNLPLSILPKEAIIFVDDCQRADDWEQANNIADNLGKNITFVKRGSKVMAIIK